MAPFVLQSCRTFSLLSFLILSLNRSSKKRIWEFTPGTAVSSWAPWFFTVWVRSAISETKQVFSDKFSWCLDSEWSAPFWHNIKFCDPVFELCERCVIMSSLCQIKGILCVVAEMLQWLKGGNDRCNYVADNFVRLQSNFLNSSLMSARHGVCSGIGASS